MENERDEAKEEARIARLAAVAMGDVKAWAEDDFRDPLAVAEEAKCKVEAKTTRRG